MKLLVLSMAFAVVLGAGPQLGLNSPEWIQFKAKHGKKYSDSTVETRRLSIYVQNKNRVDKHNSAGQVTFQLGLNKYADLSTEEVATRMNGFKGTPALLSVSVAATVPTVGAVATSIDWRTLGYVTPVKDQGQCSSCWAFSATGALEGQNFRKTGKLVSLSEQNLVDCSSNSTYGNYGCNGGNMNNAFRYVKANGGIDTGASYPYTATQGTCKYSAANIGGTCTGLVRLTQNETALMSAVAALGPISVAIDASKQSFQLYRSGVYYEPTCNSTALNHAVLLVGYGTANGTDYWLVKNSWGTTWGEQGYIRMARNRNNNCGIASAASFPTV